MGSKRQREIMRPRFHARFGGSYSVGGSSTSAPPTDSPSTPLVPGDAADASLPASQPTPSHSPTHISSNSSGPEAGDVRQPGVEGPDGRKFVSIVNEQLYPSGPISRNMTSSFKQRIEPEGYVWKNLSETTKQLYFQEFEKEFYWDSCFDAIMYKHWEKKARTRYKDLVNQIRKVDARPRYISEEIWNRWTEYWTSPAAMSISERNSANRRGGPGGASLAVHTGGSITHDETARRLEKTLGAKPTPVQVFLHTHTKKHDGVTFINTRCREVNDQIQENIQRQSEEETPVDETQTFLDVVGGRDRRGRIFGLGSYANTCYSRSSLSSTAASARPSQSHDVSELRATVDTLREQLLNQNEELLTQRQQHIEEIAKIRDEISLQMREQLRAEMTQQLREEMRTELAQVSQIRESLAQMEQDRKRREEMEQLSKMRVEMEQMTKERHHMELMAQLRQEMELLKRGGNSSEHP